MRLVVVTLMPVIFAVDVAVIIGFTVARYERSSGDREDLVAG